MIKTSIQLPTTVGQSKILSTFRALILTCKVLKRLVGPVKAIFLKIVEAGFFYFFKISAIRNSRFKAVIIAFIVLIVQSVFHYLSTYERNTVSNDFRYWLTLSIGSIVNPKKIRRAIILLNVALKSTKEPS